MMSLPVSLLAYTCLWEAPSGDPEAAHTRIPLTASESRWRRGGMDGPASLRSGWTSWSQRIPEVKHTDITLLKVQHTPVFILSKG